MSVNSKVTVPVGSAVIALILARPGG